LHAAIPAQKNTAILDIFEQNTLVLNHPETAAIAAGRNIDENGSLPYKPRQLSAMARLDRGGSFGPETARFGPASAD
jgi:hypothetical protein